jgi:hypothetical protein
MGKSFGLLILLLMFFIGSTTVSAEKTGSAVPDQSEEKMVKVLVDKYISGTYEADISILQSLFSADAVMNGNLGGKLVEGSPDSFFNDLSSMPSLKDSGAKYEANIQQLSVTGSIASVTLIETGFGPFNFTNYFHLLKKNGEWRIVSKTFTTF